MPPARRSNSDRVESPEHQRAGGDFRSGTVGCLPPDETEAGIRRRGQREGHQLRVALGALRSLGEVAIQAITGDPATAPRSSPTGGTRRNRYDPGTVKCTRMTRGVPPSGALTSHIGPPRSVGHGAGRDMEPESRRRRGLGEGGREPAAGLTRSVHDGRGEAADLGAGERGDPDIVIAWVNAAEQCLHADRVGGEAKIGAGYRDHGTGIIGDRPRRDGRVRTAGGEEEEQREPSMARLHGHNLRPPSPLRKRGAYPGAIAPWSRYEAQPSMRLSSKVTTAL